MRGGERTIKSVAGVLCTLVLTGCVSMESHRSLRAQNRSLAATKEGLAQELFEARSANDALRARNESIEREIGTNDALVANLRRENELLDQLRRTAEAAVEELAQGPNFGDIAITGPKLPEQLHDAIKQFANANPTLVTYDAARGTVKWTADLLFALGSDIVKQTSRGSLNAFTTIMKSPSAANFEVVVVGHTDNVPIVRAATKAKHPTNWHLSAHRAISVASVLRSNGYQASRIGVMGVGEYRPIADNSSPAGAAQNRRVEVYIVPIGAFAHTVPLGSAG